MLTANLWVLRGLVNGATGTLWHLIFEPGAAPPLLPLALVVEFDPGYIGPHLPGKDRYVDRSIDRSLIILYKCCYFLKNEIYTLYLISKIYVFYLFNPKMQFF